MIERMPTGDEIVDDILRLGADMSQGDILDHPEDCKAIDRITNHIEGQILQAAKHGIPGLHEIGHIILITYRMGFLCGARGAGVKDKDIEELQRLFNLTEEKAGNDGES